MPVEIRVPQLGESVLEAVVAKWLKQEGDAVAVGDALVELETEKVNQEVYAEQAGTLTAIVKQAGDTVGVGEVLGSLQVPTGAAAPPQAVEAAEAGPGPTAAGLLPVESQTQATPVARRMASGSGVDLAAVQGSGPGGRITKQDVAAALDRALPAAQPAGVPRAGDGPVPDAVPAPAPAAPALANGGQRHEQRLRMSRRRQTIARRLVEAQRTAAMLTTFNEVDMTAIGDVRRRRRDAFKERFGVGLGFMSFFTKSVVGALKAYPHLNAEIQGDEIVLKSYYDMGIAVGTDEGLVVPVVRDVDRKSFADIERDIADLAVRARTGALSLADLQGGTFTITNGGIYGSLLSTPILNAPQVGILGMHKIQDRPVVVGGEVQVRPMMYLALSYDHRLVDGSVAVRFLVRVKELLEDPETLLLEG